MSFYTELQDEALALITEFGRELPIARLAADYDPIAGAESNRTSISGTLQALILPAKASALNLVNGEGDNRIVQALVQGKLRFMLAAAKGAPFEPVANDVVTFEDSTWNVIGCTPLSPAGVPLLYKIGLMLASPAPDATETPTWDSLNSVWNDLV